MEIEISILGTLLGLAVASIALAIATKKYKDHKVMEDIKEDGEVKSPSFVTSIVAPLVGVAMVYVGATVLDHLPHSSFFHATAGAVNMNINDRLKLIPYE